MPNLRHAKKAVRKAEAHYDANRRVKNRITRWTNQTKASLTKKTKKEAEKNASTLTKLLDKAAKEHVISKNRAARIKSRIQTKVNAL